MAMRPSIWISTGLASTFLLTLGCQSKIQHSQLGVMLEKGGIFAQQDFDGLNAIQTRIFNQQLLTESDLDYCEHLITKAPLIKSDENKAEVKRKVFQYLVGKKKLTPKIADRLYAFSLKYMKDSDAMTRASAMYVHGSVREYRALVNIKQMAETDPDENTRQDAQEYAMKLEAALKKMSQ